MEKLECSYTFLQFCMTTLERAILQYFEMLEKYIFFHPAIPTFGVNLGISTFKITQGYIL